MLLPGELRGRTEYRDNPACFVTGPTQPMGLVHSLECSQDRLSHVLRRKGLEVRMEAVRVVAGRDMIENIVQRRKCVRGGSSVHDCVDPEYEK